MKADLGDAVTDAQLKAIWDKHLKPAVAREIRARTVADRDTAKLIEALGGKEIAEDTLRKVAEAGDDPAKLQRVLWDIKPATPGERLKALGVDIINAPRTLMTSWDASAPLGRGWC
jgi:hypothetical protein